MDTVVLQQFMDFFQDFLDFCSIENWPKDDTSGDEIKNAFVIAQHIENCLDKLQKLNLIDTFLSKFNNTHHHSCLLIKNCFSDPPSCVLKKIINSNCQIKHVDSAFKIFVQIFTEQKLENSLTNYMLEAASKETLLKHLSNFPKDSLLEFKSHLLLCELNNCKDAKDTLLTMINTGNQAKLEVLVVSLLNKDIEYHKSVSNIVNVFVIVMLSKNQNNQIFWKKLFNIDDKYLLQLCNEQGDIFKLICRALLECSKLIRENMSAEFFYIDLTYSELKTIVRKLCCTRNLKKNFFAVVSDSDSDIGFWENMFQT